MSVQEAATYSELDKDSEEKEKEPVAAAKEAALVDRPGGHYIEGGSTSSTGYSRAQAK